MKSKRAAKLAVTAKSNPQIGSELFDQIMGAAHYIDALEAQLAASQASLKVAVKFIETLPDDCMGMDAMGSDNQWMTWPVKDEFLHHARAALAEGEDAKEKALQANDHCKHDWFVAVGSEWPPFAICKKCGAPDQ